MMLLFNSRVFFVIHIWKIDGICVYSWKTRCRYLLGEHFLIFLANVMFLSQIWLFSTKNSLCPNPTNNLLEIFSHIVSVDFPLNSGKSDWQCKQRLMNPEQANKTFRKYFELCIFEFRGKVQNKYLTLKVCKYVWIYFYCSCQYDSFFVAVNRMLHNIKA